MQGIIINDIQIIKIFDGSTSIFMTEKTLNKLFDLELCIDHMFSWLSESLPEIVTKFNRFVNIVKSPNSKDYVTNLVHKAFNNKKKTYLFETTSRFHHLIPPTPQDIIDENVFYPPT